MTLIIAHRGFSGNYPENTMLSIRKAIELGVDLIELDVWLTLDHNLVVIHDPRLNRTTNGKGSVVWKRLAELKKLRIKGSHQPIPTLDEVLALARKSEVTLNIELKSVWAAKPTVELVEKHSLQDRVIISSGKLGAIRIAKNTDPRIKTAFIFYVSNNDKWDAFVTLMAKLLGKLTQAAVIRLARAVRADYVHPSYPFAVNGFVKKLHKNGFKVNVWTVNTKPLMRKLIKNGVDGIITNHPDRLKAVLSEKPKKRRRIFKLSLS
jgi:glycerophosphoryl diester phosphodiesterase